MSHDAISLTDVLADALQAPEFGMPAEVAATLAGEIIRVAAARSHAGTEYYLPTTATKLTREERDAEIRRQWHGRNVRELCRRYGVSRPTLYRIVRRGEGMRESA